MDTANARALVKPILTIAATALMTVWGVTSLTNGDPLWFLRRLDARAERLVIYWDGTVVSIDRDSPGYEAVMSTFAEAITHPAGYEGSVGLSETSIADYRERYRLLEVIFDGPVQIHTRHPVSEAATFLVPLNKTHARFRRAFAFPGRVPSAIGPLTISDARFEALLAAVESAVSLASAQ